MVEHYKKVISWCSPIRNGVMFQTAITQAAFRSDAHVVQRRPEHHRGHLHRLCVHGSHFCQESQQPDPSLNQVLAFYLGIPISDIYCTR